MTQYVDLPNEVTAYVSTPDAAALDITGDIQGTPNQVRMGSGVPENWTVVNDEPA